MKPNEVSALLKVCFTYQQRVGDADPETVRDAWFYALDMRMTLEEATVIVIALAAENTWISPGSINEKFLARYRKAHEQGTSRAKLPGQEKPAASPAPLQIGAPTPVKPQDVEGYMEKRAATATIPPKVLTVPCTYCGAKPGKPCTRWGTDKRRVDMRYPHPSRYEAAGLPDPVVDRVQLTVDTTAL